MEWLAVSEELSHRGTFSESEITTSALGKERTARRSA